MRLPALRQELEFYESAPNPVGGSTWLIYDVVRHRYFEIGANEAEVLRLWRPGSLEDFCRAAGLHLHREVKEKELADLVYFLQANSLTEQTASGKSRDYAAQQKAGKRNLLHQAIHSYLFVRIPLVRPNSILVATRGVTSVFFNPVVLCVIALMGLGGLYFVSRQWEVFTSTFLHFLTFEGLLIYSCAIVFVKIFHELGHAYAAARYDVRVTTMGIAFMVMIPLLYTDVTDAWRLRSRRKRLIIAAAGILVELSLACVATFFWVFLPDGPVRSAAFVVATTSWILSLAINLNPFMKFDGYYLIADFFAIPNLQPRSFALARWQIREWLFGLDHPPPEGLPTKWRRALVAYGISVWTYRFFLFIGIALLVYYLFFKLLGVVLFAIEIIWFIALPVWREVMEWWSLREEIVIRRRAWISLACVACSITFLLVPVRWSVTLPAITVAQTDIAVFPPRPARVTSLELHEGRPVQTGDVLVRLESPDLNHELVKVTHAIRLLDDRLARIAGDTVDRMQRTVIEQERMARVAEREGLERQKERLAIRAQNSGELRDVQPDLHAGAWLSKQQRIARIVGRGIVEVRAYANEDVLHRLIFGAEGVFIPDDPSQQRRAVVLKDIARAGVAELEMPYLASVNGGTVASERDGEGKIRPRRSQYVLRLSHEGPRPHRVVRGVIKLPGKAEALVQSIWRQVVRVLVRESGI